MTTTFQRLACALVLGLTVSASALAQAQAPLTTQDAVQVSVTAKVEALDLATREVTLKGPLGNEKAFRNKIQSILSDPAQRNRLVNELGLKKEE